MRPIEQTLTTHVSSPVFEEMGMKIDQSALVHLMTVLTDLYSNPALAVIREYSTNAWDSHVEAGVKAPIEIGLPSTFNPAFTVTDHGLGLSLDDLRYRYSMYGASSKRGSDDVNGMLGLGCKSGLTYALSFSVTAVKGGVKTIATITKDADGVGVIKILDTVSTDEHNGVQISIPVKSMDIERFRTEAKAFYSYWLPGTVKIDGKAPKSVLDELGPEKVIWLDDDLAVMIGNNGYSSPRGSRIVMGNVSYPVPDKLAQRQSSMIHGATTHDRQFVAWVPIGSVHFTPSREALQETKQTKAKILEIQERIDREFGRAVEKRVAKLKSPFEKMVLLHTWQHDPVVRKNEVAPNVRRVVHPQRHEEGVLTPIPSLSFSWDGYSSSKLEGPLTAMTFLPRTKHVVKDFPYKGLSVLHKERFKAFGIESCVIIPDATDLSPIDGRENIVSWGTIVEETAKPNMPKSLVPRDRVKTLYTWFFKGKRQDPIEVIPGGPEPILYVHHDERNMHDLFQHTKVAVITSQQDARFVRLHPGARWFSVYVQEQRELATKALTDVDRIRNTTPPARTLKEFKVEDLHDPDLVKVKEANTGPISATLHRANELGVTAKMQPHPVHGILENRYPLWAKMATWIGTSVADKQDVIVYFNAKYASLQPADEQ